MLLEVFLALIVGIVFCFVVIFEVIIPLFSNLPLFPIFRKSSTAKKSSAQEIQNALIKTELELKEKEKQRDLLRQQVEALQKTKKN